MKQKMELAALLLVGGIPLAQAASVVVDAAKSPWSTVSGSLATAGSGALGTVSGSVGTTSGATGTVSGSTGTTSGAVDTIPPVVMASAAQGTYPAPIYVYIKATDNKDPAPKIYYATDGTYPSTSSAVYGGQGFYVSESHNELDLDLRTLAVDKSGNFARQRFTYRIEDKLAPSVSTSVAPGTYNTPQSIVLSAYDRSDAKPQLYYTTDGTLPKKQKANIYKPGTILVAKDIGSNIDLRIRTLTIDTSNNWQRNIFDYRINKNQPPVSAFTVVVSGSMAAFSPVGSKDEDGYIKSLEWTFGDNGASKAVTSFVTDIDHHYKKLGTYNVKLKVIDNLGASVITKQSVTIKPQPVYSPITGRLNDTGITQCTNGSYTPVKCPVKTMPGQDAQYGQDKNNFYHYDGHAGFQFTRLDYTGFPAPYYYIDNESHCVWDNTTGLVWEIKTEDGGLRDKDNTYTWFNENRIVNNNDAGLQNGGKCSGDISCDSDAYIKAVNKSALCGYTDWRLPTANELLGIVDFSVAQPGPTIDQNYFFETVPDNYLTSDSYSAGSAVVRVISFSSGAPFFSLKSTPAYIRLVRGDKKQ